MADREERTKVLQESSETTDPKSDQPEEEQLEHGEGIKYAILNQFYNFRMTIISIKDEISIVMILVMLGALAIILGLLLMHGESDYIVNATLLFVFIPWALLTVAAAKAQGGGTREPQQLRLTHFNGWRFIGCVFIMIYHWTKRGPARSASLARATVKFYILLSGFMTQYVYHSKMLARPFQFCARRCLRLLPIYELTHFVTAKYKYGDLWFDFYNTALMTCFWNLEYPVTNGPSWTVATLTYFWLVSPAFAWVFARLRSINAPNMLFCALAFGAVKEIAVFIIHGVDLGPRVYNLSIAHNLVAYLMGMGIAEAARYMPAAEEGFWAWFWPAWSDLTLILLLGSTYGGSEEANRQIYSCNDIALAIWLFASVLGRPSLLSRITKHPVLDALGKYSMHMYMCAVPIQKLMYPLEALWKNKVQKLYLFGVIAVVSIALADLVENPWNRWLRSKTEEASSTTTVDDIIEAPARCLRRLFKTAPEVPTTEIEESMSENTEMI